MFNLIPPLLSYLALFLVMASESQSSALDSLSSALASAPPSEILHGGRRWRAIKHAPNKKRNGKRGQAWSFG